MTTPVQLSADNADGSADDRPVVPIIGPADAPLLLRGLFEGGDPGPIAGALANVPELCDVALPFLGAALAPSAVPLRLKEIAILRTSALFGCRYCVDAHTVVAHDAGFSGDQLCVLRLESAEDRFDDPAEAAVLRWVDHVAGARGALPPEAADDLKPHLADHQIVELTVTIGATMLLNRFATSLRLPTSDDTTARLVELHMATWDAEVQVRS